MKLMKRMLAIMLAAVMLLSNFSGTIYADTLAHNSIAAKSADAATVNNWQEIFLKDSVDTTQAGGIWTDKSVFETAADYLEATHEQESFDLSLDNENNFLVALSVIASTKSIVGYDSQPTDTMFILDVSGSMSGSRAKNMVEAANDAMERLLELNLNNRVGVVLYSGNTQIGDSSADTAMLLLPLDRYTRTTREGDVTMSELLYLDNSERISANSNVKNSNNQTMPTGSGARKSVSGGTYIQNGLYQAMEEMIAEDNETVISSGIQAGTPRSPMLVLMSDGAPTAGTNSYANIGTSKMGDGTDSDDEIAFVTQLTAAHVKQKVAEKYNTDVSFYTLGLSVGDDKQAMSVMDPAVSTATINAYWQEYQNDQNGDGYVDLRNYDLQSGQGNTKDVKIGHTLEQYYVDRYFPAGTADSLADAFENIVQEIILQSKYYPTNTGTGMQDVDGYVFFRDYIGQNMEVKHVLGVQHGGLLYTGEQFARTVKYGMGTVEHPTDEGNALVWGLIRKLKIGDIRDSEAIQTVHELITKAWQNGQLAYNDHDPDNFNWSNYIGWFSDADGVCLGFWDGTEAGLMEAPAGAVQAVKDYCLLGEVEENSLRAADMLYATIEVRTDIVEENGTAKLGEQTVHGKLPAALIPMIHYSVELDTDDPATAKNITMTVKETTPSRLLYEVGLHGEVDLLDIAGTAPMPEALETDANGDYVFYTNQWERTYTDISEANPNKDHNTFVYFVPSAENERYVFHERTAIMEPNGAGGYVRYTGSEAPAGDGYYHEHYIYTATGNGNGAKSSIVYAQIPAAALTADTLEQVDGLWYIRKGTVHLYEARGYSVKEGAEGGATETLPYSEYPVVHNDPVKGYHLDAILGNNGKLTIDAPEGIKITKQVDGTITDRTLRYGFGLTMTGAADGVYHMVEEAADGTRTESRIVFADGQARLELAAGASVYIILPAGAVVTVTEDRSELFKLVSINGDPNAEAAVLTVEENTISEAVFLNTRRVVGDAMISKTVVNGVEMHYSPNFRFAFTVTVTDAEPETAYASVYMSDAGSYAGPQLVTNADGTGFVEIALGHNEELLLKDLPDGAKVVAVETQRSGFASNHAEDRAEAVVESGETVYLEFVNTYEADPTDLPLGVMVCVSKLFEGRPWMEGDSFTFELQKLVDGRTETIAVVTIDADDPDHMAAFTVDEFLNEAFTEAGTYSYRIVEVAGDLAGVTYDGTVAGFDLIVTDEGEGKLKVSDVIGYHADVTGGMENGWVVTAGFHNVYSTEGSIQLAVTVSKTVENDTGVPVSAEGFRFAMYPADEDFVPVEGAAPVVITTNAAGTAFFEELVFTEENTYRYVLQELNDGVPGIDYDETVYEIEIVVTDDPETARLVADVYVNGEWINSGESISYQAAFENSYTATAAEVTLSGGKELTGRELKDGEFTFALYHASEVGEIGAYITSVTNEGEGFVFADLEELTFDKVGTYCFAIQEVAGELGGVTYDETVYYATVTVTGTADARLTATVHYTDDNGHAVAPTFHNTYRPAAVTAEIVGTKTLIGSELTKGSFAFGLYEAGAAEPVQTVTNGSGAGAGDLLFTLEFAEAGEYSYLVKEEIPDGETYGITYDESVFEVVVTVTDNGDGTMSASVDYPDGAVDFVNEYHAAPVTAAAITGTKTLNGLELEAGMFTFELYEADVNYQAVSERPLQSTTNDADGSFRFAPMEFTENGGYRYIVVEKAQINGEVPADTITYDTTTYCVSVTVVDNGHGELEASVRIFVLGYENDVSEISFTNSYEPKTVSTDLGLVGKKVLEGGLALTEGMFTFGVYKSDAQGSCEASNQIATVTNAADGSIHFGTFDFDAAGTYWLLIREEAGTLETVTYDETTYLLKVEVTDVDGRLQAAVTEINGEAYADGLVLTFTNTHTPVSTGVVISGEKTLSGRELVDGEFSFELYETGSDFQIMEGQTALQTVTNQGGAFAFTELTYAEIGVRYYVLKEQAGTAEGVTYDETVYYVTVTVENEAGTLVTRVEYHVGTELKEKPVFANTYNQPIPDPDPIEVVLPVVKIMENRGGSHTGVADFRFELLNGKGETVAVIVSDSRGKAVFELGSFDHDDVGKEFTYYIREVDTGLSDVIYSTKVYTVRVAIYESDGGLYALIWKDGVLLDSGDAFVFTNVTVGETPVVPTPSKPGSPDTGDESLTPWIVSLAVGLLGLMTTGYCFFRRKTK